ncbi:MAG: hypothetical protein A2991_02165 [Candidatus Terrybacteria bacterium RIFCSPLOWO2_01_FULL_58_14]|uniref:Uncharacterized protein n=2 Tax=Candidatus Terryibacteriota TaxID=1817920 RepID=A0A1G2PZ75_9BACT|nr:MAG: hypothetical protein A2682_03045 [Candidatus Terrybacteria bacterium RIFCSPHIGHO2_01_FULL_58_15]OHA53637.1 MAG: hypothetical protein A2991_02165 [Candidatus Terrybacteria bacterium RIFCSPLOWO2_01_FULL_58_14]
MSNVRIFSSFRKDADVAAVIRWHAARWQLFVFPQGEMARGFPERRAEGVEMGDFPFSRLSGIPDPLILALPIDAGTVHDVRIPWQRSLPREPVSLTEFRTVLTEARTRAREAARRRGFSGGDAAAEIQTVRHVLLDGKRLLNPVGFSGRTLVVFATETFLFPPAADFLQTFSQKLPQRRILTLLLDDAVREYAFRGRSAPARLSSSGPGSERTISQDAFVVLDEEATAVWTFTDGMAGERTSIAIGQASMRRHFMRSFGFASESEDEAGRILLAFGERRLGTTLMRRIDTALLPAFRSWAEGVSRAISPLHRHREPGEITVVAAVPFAPLFSRAFGTRTLRNAFPMFGSPRFRIIPLVEFLGLSPGIPWEELQAAACARVARLMPGLASL